jgi:hypothetical protein
VDFRNNVLYNWGENNVYAGEGGNYNVVNNYYKHGPSTKDNVKTRVLNPYKIEKGSNPLPYGKFYLTGNYVDASADVTRHNWRGVTMNGGTAADTVQAKATTPFNLGPISTQTAAEAYKAVLQHVGASLPKRDTLDQRIIRNVVNRTGRIIDVQGGYPHGTPYAVSQNAWPALASVPAPTDTDHDGMPDAWETKQRLNPQDPTDRAKIGRNGYTVLETYLNSLAAPVAPRK